MARLACITALACAQLCACTAPTLVVGVLYGVRTPRSARETPDSQAAARSSVRTRVIGFVALELAFERTLDRADEAARAEGSEESLVPGELAEPSQSECELPVLCDWEQAAREQALLQATPAAVGAEQDDVLEQAP